MPLDPGPLGDASVVADGDTWTLIFIRDLRHPPAAVWRALTDPAEIDRWAPFRPDRDLGTTGDAVLTMVDGAEHTDLPGIVLRAEAPALLEYTWGADRLRWDLEATAGGTRLTLRHTSAERDIEAMVAAGWHLCFVVLERLLDGEPVEAVRGDAAREHGWADLRDGYAVKFA
ncbi:SRPBCC family protein [Jidongwangia harbinensis]|uniref:SRPBCC family protein n=1 Tax=Jidongwangia harbinensis TaxID=2878561 RepID=UPI001CD938D7|nr:SRPBCC family protein [Jidongwangia harbinensis]MCA2218819.1 SRPBCC family protein [Jidongwangia harbinensis]